MISRMKMVLLVALCFVISPLALCGCDPSEMHSNSKGETFLFNKWTGTTYKVIENRLVELQKDPKQSSLKTFSNSRIQKHNLLVTCQARFRNNNLYYKVGLRPDAANKSEDKEKKPALKEGKPSKSGWDSIPDQTWDSEIQEMASDPSKRVTISFRDDLGFNVASVPISLREFVRILDSGGSVSGFEAQDSMKIEVEDWNAITHWTVGWNF